MAEEVDIDNLTTDEEVGILLQDLPTPVQRFLTSPERNAVSLALSQKYQLHSDTAGAFDRSYVYMLLGIYTPEEFVSELRKAGLPETTIRGLSADVNELVFKKLREEERTGTVSPKIATPPQVPVMEIVSRQEVPANLPGQDIRPQVPVPPAPAYVPPAPVPSAAPVPPPVPAPTPATPSVPVPHIAARTMASDVELITRGYQAVASGQPLAPAPAQPAYAPAPVLPPQPPAIPVYAVPVQPIAAPAPPVPAYPAPVMASVHRTPVDRTHERDPITKEYGTDPYREPIDI